jgi:diguanylate cyclase (GGDEF)-like protein/PAS domain S-box-containing protein
MEIVKGDMVSKSIDQNSYIDIFPFPVSLKNGDLAYTRCNQAFADLIGKPIDEIIGSYDHDLFTSEVAEKISNMDLQCLSYEHIREETTFSVDGVTSYDVLLYLNRIEDDGVIVGISTSFIDITELKLVEASLTTDKDIIRSILDTQSNFIVVTDGVFLKTINSAFLNYLGVTDITEFNDRFYCVTEIFEPIEGMFTNANKQMGSMNWMDDILALEPEKRLVAIRGCDEGVISYFSVHINRVEDQEVMYVVSFDDVTEITLKSQSYQYAAHHDELTGTYNKGYFQTYLPYIMKKQVEKNNKLSVIMFDIDHFKVINDTLGHLVGDSVLKELCELISSHQRQSDTFVRWGGEEFIVILKGCALEDAKCSAETFRQLIEAYDFTSVDSVTCSFGVVEMDQHESRENLLERLDKQLYRAKNETQNCVCA